MDEIRWDLTEFYPGPKSPELEADIALIRQRAKEFQVRYQGRINRPDLDATTLAAALAELEEIGILGTRIGVYAFLLFSLDTRNEESSALKTRTQELDVDVEREMLFFNLEWRRVPEETAAALIADPALARWRHYLEMERALAPHTLSEAEEAILNELSPTASAWVDHFTKIMGRIEVGGKPLAGALSALFDPSPDRRKKVQQATTRVLKRTAPYVIDILNALLKDRQIKAKLRGYSGSLEARNLANEISGEAVEALLSTCDRNTELPARCYALKRKLLGLPRLYDWDRYAPLFQTARENISLQEARETIVAAYTDFDPAVGAIVDRFFTESWIDTASAVGKQDGAYAMPCSFLHPFILMSWEGTKRDVAVLAHELGHGLHDVLCQEVSLLQNHPPTTLAETASVFGEQLVFERLLAQTANPKERLALLCAKIDDTLATV
ncbi:MAG: M3 family metallopeptidase, partial [Patescibacteria group bacterium]